jgi:hypothetical protein
MAIDNFIPEIWAAGVTQSFIANQVVIPTLNTQFTGNVTSGNKVHIINATTPTIVDYADNGRTITAEALGDTEVTLLIDQEKAFSVNVDDVDAVQSSSSFGPWVDAAGKALAEDAEAYVIAQMLAGATNGQGSSPVAVDTFAEAKAAVLKIRKLMSNAKVPTADRFMVVNPDFADLLISGLSDVALAGGAEELRNGQVLRLGGFNIIESALLDSETPAAVGYHSGMVAFANQINSLESLRNPTKFADIVRGLNVYGAKVLKSAAVVKYVSA